MMWLFLIGMILLTSYEVGSIVLKRLDKECDFISGYTSAKALIEDGEDPQKLLNQEKSDLHYGEFNRGWIKACKEHLK